MNDKTYGPNLFIEDMAEIHGVSVRQIYDEMKLPTWPYVELPKMGRRRRWSRDQVFAVIANARPSRRVSRFASAGAR